MAVCGCVTKLVTTYLVHASHMDCQRVLYGILTLYHVAHAENASFCSLAFLCTAVSKSDRVHVHGYTCRHTCRHWLVS